MRYLARQTGSRTNFGGLPCWKLESRPLSRSPHRTGGLLVLLFVCQTKPFCRFIKGDPVAQPMQHVGAAGLARLSTSLLSAPANSSAVGNPRIDKWLRDAQPKQRQELCAHEIAGFIKEENRANQSLARGPGCEGSASEGHRRRFEIRTGPRRAYNVSRFQVDPGSGECLA